MTARVTVVAVPLDRTIRLGSMEIRGREYAVVRLGGDEGFEGVAIGYTRGLPVGGIRLESLLEIARRDLEAKRAGLPLWRLLGGDKARVPILAVGGYFIEQRTVEDV